MYNDEQNLYHYNYRKDGSEPEANQPQRPSVDQQLEQYRQSQQAQQNAYQPQQAQQNTYCHTMDNGTTSHAIKSNPLPGSIGHDGKGMPGNHCQQCQQRKADSTYRKA